MSKYQEYPLPTWGNGSKGRIIRRLGRAGGARLVIDNPDGSQVSISLGKRHVESLARILNFIVIDDYTNSTSEWSDEDFWRYQHEQEEAAIEAEERAAADS